MNHLPKAIIIAFIAASLASNAHSTISCNDVAYGSENYQENMRKLALMAGIKGGNFNRYHEDLKSAICASRINEIRTSIDRGFITSAEADIFTAQLVRSQSRSETGKSYGYSKQRFSEMGLCSACADNVAQHYTRTPNSRCGKLAKASLEGNPAAIAELERFPSYCQWHY